ncbi:MAG TPA: tail fiber domain-containing protein [Verrucomicrobiae bacterium]|jgi:hypothetical protein|nr:tail fiber domain-containing protein [Verrucomicrobiae bacterium]
MKNLHARSRAASAWLVYGVCLLSVGLFAQTTAFTYQGNLNNGANTANGAYDFSFTLFDAAADGNNQGSLTNSGVGVTNGFFTSLLDFGPAAFNGSSLWLEIAVRTNAGGAFTILSPRQRVTPTPYALYAATAGRAGSANAVGGVAAANIAQLNIPNTSVPATAAITVLNGFVVGADIVNAGFGYTSAPTVSVTDATGSNAVLVANLTNSSVASLTIQNAGHNYSAGAAILIAAPPSNGRQTIATINNFSGMNILTNTANTFAGSFSGNGGALTNVNAATVGGFSGTMFWKTNGNAGANSANGAFLGTSDNQALEIHVNGLRALRVEPNASGPNLIGGYAGNLVDSNSFGVVIGGGGGSGFVNHASSTLATIGGGSGNVIGASANDCVIGGGRQNIIDSGNWRAFIGGGSGNWIQAGSSPGSGVSSTSSAVIAGGFGNTIISNAYESAIGGGAGNSIASVFSDIPGGRNNRIEVLANDADIGGGTGNIIQTNAYNSVIGGGFTNRIQTNAIRSLIGGGSANTILTNASYAIIVAGLNNTNGSPYSFLGGGSNNFISTAALAVLSGGASNIASGYAAAIPGGYHNLAAGDYSFAAGLNAQTMHNNSFIWSDGSTNTSSTGTNQFIARASGGVILYTSTDTSTGASLPAGSGAWASLSDRNSKDSFSQINPSDVLAKVVAMPLQTWHYKAQDSSVRHLGPMAQDFRAAFGLGEDERHITTIDSEGVALAAIQGLNQKLEAKDAEIRALQMRLEKLERLLPAK